MNDKTDTVFHDVLFLLQINVPHFHSGIIVGEFDREIMLHLWSSSVQAHVALDNCMHVHKVMVWNLNCDDE